MGSCCSRDHSMDNVPYTLGLYDVRVPDTIKIDRFDDIEHGRLPDWERMNRTNNLMYYMRPMTKEEYRKKYCEYKAGNWWLVRK